MTEPEPIPTGQAGSKHAPLPEAIAYLAQAEWECGYAAGRDGVIGPAERERREKWWARVRELLAAIADDADG